LKPSKILTLPSTIRPNALKALIALSKHQGTYLMFKEKLRQYGIKWVKPDNFSVFLGILNNTHEDLKDWYRATQKILDADYKLFLKFVLLSGLRKGEALTAFNKIISLTQRNRLKEYYNKSFLCLNITDIQLSF